MSGKTEWTGDFCVETAPTPAIVVLFGAGGDLAGRKLLPALYQLYRAKLLHRDSRIACCLRSTEGFREKIRAFLPTGGIDLRDAFLDLLDPVTGDYRHDGFFADLRRYLQDMDRRPSCKPCNRLFYLAIPPDAFAGTVAFLSHAGLLDEPGNGAPWSHVVLEKPFGRDLTSARELDTLLHRYLREEQIYRIDHYLGKETVQNIAILRFANAIFEPLWNRHYIDHVQITIAEDLGVEHRAGYYEESGLVRDMFQNHMLEMLSLAAMEMPESFAADDVRDEQRKVIDAIRRYDAGAWAANCVRGQYIAGNGMAGYLDEPGVNPASQTETYAAARLFIDNRRWQGVPFYIRSGKRLAARNSEIAVVFKKIAHSIFSPVPAESIAGDTLVMHVQPEEGMDLTIQAKHPGPRLCMGPMTLHFHYSELAEKSELTEAYARLLQDAMLGDPTLFMRSDLISSGWELFTPLLQLWENAPETMPLYNYAAGSDGPAEAAAMLRQDDREWRPVC